jgi:4-amino-4-deoxy-L-arabinose transferase-like glycosyltransferase
MLVFAVGFVFRCWSIGTDLPNLYVADEPHHLNMAAHFASGDLNPHDFKYPSLWKYLLAVLLGVLYAAFLWLGLVASSADFASWFFHEPTVFYLSARLLAAACFALGAAMLFDAGRRYVDAATGLFMAFMLTLSPQLLLFGRDATLNSVMIMFVCCAIHALFGLQYRARRRDYLAAGLSVGLAISSHYIAAPLCLLMVLFHFQTSRIQRVHLNLVFGLIAIVGGFFIGSPYFFFDWRSAISDVFSLSQLHVPAVGQLQSNELATRAHSAWEQFLSLLKNLSRFLDPWALGSVSVLGCILFHPDRLRLLMWCLPAAVTSVAFAATYHGFFYRYSLAVYIPLLVPAAIGMSLLVRRLAHYRVAAWLLIAAVFALFMGRAIAFERERSLPDTRTLARSWILENVSAGESVFIDVPFNGPQLRMSRAQAGDLLEKTRVIGHPRRFYYEALLHNHPGGGYRLFYLRRGLVEVEDTPERTARSYEAQDTVNPVDDGFGTFVDNGVKIVVLSHSIDPARNQKWLTEMKSQCPLQVSFSPDNIHTKGKSIEIYRCPEVRTNG